MQILILVVIAEKGVLGFEAGVCCFGVLSLWTSLCFCKSEYSNIVLINNNDQKVGLTSLYHCSTSVLFIFQFLKEGITI